MGNGRNINQTRVVSSGRRNGTGDAPTPRPAITPEQRRQMQLMQTAAAILQTIRAPANIAIPRGTTISLVRPERPGGRLGPQTTSTRGVGEVSQHTSVHKPIENGGQVYDVVVDLTIDDIIADTSVPQALSSLSTSTSSNISAGGSPQILEKGKRLLRGTAPTKTSAKKSRTEDSDNTERGPVVQVLDVQIINPGEQPGPSHQNVVPQKEVGGESGRTINKEDNNGGIDVFSQETHRETFVAASEAIRCWKNEILQQERAVADAVELMKKRQVDAEHHRRELRRCSDDITGALAEQKKRKQRIELLKDRIRAFLDVCRD